MKFDKNKYDSQYVKANVRQFMLKVSRIYDSDMVVWLESQQNISQYLHNLVRKDMEEQKVNFDADYPETTPERAIRFKRVNPKRTSAGVTQESDSFETEPSSP